MTTKANPSDSKKREEMVDRLHILLNDLPLFHKEVLADFILEQQAKAVAEVVEPLQRNILKYPTDQRFPVDRINYPDAKLAVIKALEKAREYL